MKQKTNKINQIKICVYSVGKLIYKQKEKQQNGGNICKDDQLIFFLLKTFLSW